MSYLRLIITLALAFLAGGCVTQLRPAAKLHDPVTVYVVDIGRTSSLIIPADDQQAVRYAYGDWSWYALRNTGPFDAMAALFWPTQGALGRHRYDHWPTPQSLKDELGYENLYTVQAERARVDRLRARLDAQFQQRKNSLVQTPDVHLEFVRSSATYWFGHNSNHATAYWLSEMGVQVEGMPVLSIWDVRDQR